MIARVHGIATAAGCQLVATCDLAVAAEEARFATPGVRIGLFCSTPMVPLSRAIGRKRALQMLLTGEPIDARDRARLGARQQGRARPSGWTTPSPSWPSAIGRASPLTVGIGKRAFYDQVDLDERGAYDLTKTVMSMNAMARRRAGGDRRVSREARRRVDELLTPHSASGTLASATNHGGWTLRISTSGLRVSLALAGVTAAALIAAASPAAAQPTGLAVGSMCAVGGDSGGVSVRPRHRARAAAMTQRCRRCRPRRSPRCPAKTGVVSIPIYFHVITDGTTGLVSDTTINKQIVALNKSYSGQPRRGQDGLPLPRRRR